MCVFFYQPDRKLVLTAKFRTIDEWTETGNPALFH